MTLTFNQQTELEEFPWNSVVVTYRDFWAQFSTSFPEHGLSHGIYADDLLPEKFPLYLSWIENYFNPEPIDPEVIESSLTRMRELVR